MPRPRLGPAGVEFSLFTLCLLTTNAQRPLPSRAGRFVVKAVEKVIGAFGSRPNHGAAISRDARGGAPQGLKALPGVDQFAALIVVQFQHIEFQQPSMVFSLAVGTYMRMPPVPTVKQEI